MSGLRLREGLREGSRATTHSLVAMISGALGLILVFIVGVPAAAESYRCEEKPLVVKIHADWCGSCRATQTTWEKVKSDLSDQATMVQFDVTDRASYEAAVAEAERRGILDFLNEFRRRTGSIAVLDCKTRKPLVVLSGERDFGKYRDAIQQANPPS